MSIRTKELKPEYWPQVVELFGERGACGGCWCMAWRLRAKDWEAGRGTPHKRRFGHLVRSARAHGILAFDAETPVGWLSFDRRLDYQRLQFARTLRCDDAEKVWSVPCFFVLGDYRGQGVASHMLEHAVKAIGRRGGRIVEGYPVQPTKDGKPLPGAFAWTGTPSLFRKAGFELVGNRGGSKERWRRVLP